MEMINFLQYVLLVGVMYLSEYVVFGLWYRFFIKSNVKYTKFIHKMVGHYCSRIFYLSGRLRESAPEGLSTTFADAIGMPLFAAMFILLINNWIIQVIFFCVPAAVIFEKLFREEKQKRAIQIHKWIQYLYSPQHQRQVNEGNVEETGDKADIEISKENILRNKCSSGIFVDPLLAEWKESVLHMCTELKIQQLTVLSEKSFIQNFNGKLAVASRDDEGVPVIVLSLKEINQMRVDQTSQSVHNMVLFLIGHELSHIHYKDYNERLIAFKRLKSLALVVASMYVLWHVYSQFKAIEALSIGCFWLFIFLWLFCLMTFMKAEYWYFLREFRADRIGAGISGASFNEIKYILRLENKSQKRTPDNGVIKNVSRKIIGQPTHPGSERRLYELTRKQGWDLFEYIRYAVLFLFQRIR